MAYRPMSRPDPLDPPRPSAAPIPVDGNQRSDLEGGLSLAELATALSTHGGGDLSADLALDLVLNEIVEHARLATGATAAAVALAREDEIVCRATTGDNAPDLGVRLDAHSGLSGACVQSKTWQRCDDSETDRRVDAQICRSLGVRSILVFPVLREDKLLGVFEIFSPRPRAFSDREIQTLQALSRSIVNNVDRAADVLDPVAHAQPTAPATVAPTVDAYSRVADVASADVSQPDTPAYTIELLQETAAASGIRAREYWATALTLAVVAVALVLGWMLGYVGRQESSARSRAKAAMNLAARAVAQPSESAATNAGGGQVGLPGQPTPTPAPASSQYGRSGVTPAGGLVVYENGKVIFRVDPPHAAPSAEDNSIHTLMVPAKVADEYVEQRVEPDYPAPAREQHIQGPVVLVALVSKEGVVEKLTTVSGDPELVAAATDAVQQWRFKPFFRNGSPEEFQTQVTVSFRLP